VAARAGVLRFRCFIRDGGELVGMEDGAVRALAQNLVAATGSFDGREFREIRIHANASAAALNSHGAKIKFVKMLTVINC
jgi:hypothetical protein